MDTTLFVTAIFEHLLRDGVRICHWKSNLALDDALAGRGDLDVLLLEDDRKGLEAAFAHFGFAQILSPWEKRYPGLEDWLGVYEGWRVAYRAESARPALLCIG